MAPADSRPVNLSRQSGRRVAHGNGAVVRRKRRATPPRRSREDGVRPLDSGAKSAFTFRTVPKRRRPSRPSSCPDGSSRRLLQPAAQGAVARTARGEEAMDDIVRRAFMQGARRSEHSHSPVGGVEVLLTAAQARAQGVPLRMLTPDEAQTLEAVGETLAIGARQAGIAHFVDQQLALTAGLRAADHPHERGSPAICRFLPRRPGRDRAREPSRSTAATYAALTAAEQRDLVTRLRQNKIEGWQGPSQVVRLRHAAQRCDRCGLRHGGGLCAPQACPTCPTSFPQQELVTWRHVEKVDAVIVGAGRGGSGVRSGAGARRQEAWWCSSRGRTGSSPTSSAPTSGRGACAAAVQPIRLRGPTSRRSHRRSRLGHGRRGAALLRQFSPPAAVAISP